MKVAELVKAATAARAAAFAKTDEKTANAIATAILQEIGRQIDATSEGRVAIAGLGNFVIKQVEDATKAAVGGKQKRVLLRRPAAK